MSGSCRLDTRFNRSTRYFSEGSSWRAEPRAPRSDYPDWRSIGGVSNQYLQLISTEGAAVTSATRSIGRPRHFVAVVAASEHEPRGALYSVETYYTDLPVWSRSTPARRRSRFRAFNDIFLTDGTGWAAGLEPSSNNAPGTNGMDRYTSATAGGIDELNQGAPSLLRPPARSQVRG